jgi:hypothetical protein
VVFVLGEDAVGPVSSTGAVGLWCGQCGESLAQGSHARCVRRAELEPPRFCVHCRRRMKVQVTPGAWTATCVRHGTVEMPTWSA